MTEIAEFLLKPKERPPFLLVLGQPQLAEIDDISGGALIFRRYIEAFEKQHPHGGVTLAPEPSWQRPES